MLVIVPRRSVLTHIDDLLKNHPKTNGQSIRFLLQEIVAGLSTFQTSFHQRLSPRTGRIAHVSLISTFDLHS